MASTDNGKQQITFKYQQEGTAEGFNKLLAGVIPTGIINGGEFLKISDTQVDITPMQMMISDGSVVVHIQTTENAHVNVSPSLPYVIARFNWINLVNNYVDFEAVNYNSLSSNFIIFGKCEFEGSILQSFDETRRSWSPSHFNNDFQHNSFYGAIPNFLITSREDSESLGFDVGAGKAIIDGKRVEINQVQHITLVDDNPSSNLYFNPSISNGRVDIAVLKNDGNVDYIMGEDQINPKPPIFPSYGLVLATFEFDVSVNDGKIKGSSIKNIYNNNYIGSSSIIGKRVGANIVNPHTLYL